MSFFSRLASWSFTTTAAITVVAFAVPESTIAAQAQSQGSVRGTVTAINGRPLNGVLVQLDADKLGVSTERDGSYRLLRVPSGAHSITFRYIGYSARTLQVNVPNNASVTLDAKLEVAVVKLSSVLVSGQVAGQAAALNQQRAAGNISSVIDNELVGRLPDPNLAEALARVPGVAVVRDQGEGRFVQIRGSNPDWNSMSLNGLRVSTPEQSSRQLPMDVIPSDQASAIQVSKTLTPDMDADAIGGNVNLVTRTATARRPLFNVTSAGGQNQLGGGGLLNLGLNAGKRFGASQKFGAMIGGTYYKNDRASQNYEGTWCSQVGNCGAGATLASLDVPQLWELRDYPQVNRLRQGANATFDYLLSNNSKLFLRGTFNEFSDDEVRFRTRFDFFGNTAARGTIVTPDSGVVTGARLTRDIRLRKVTQQIYTAQLGGEHNFTNGSAFDWVLGTSRAQEDRPNVRTLAFRQNGTTLAYNFADADRPRANVVSPTNAYDDPARFPLNSLTREVRATRDNDVSGKANFTFPISTGAFAGTIKIGGSARIKDRTNKLTQTAYTSALGTNSNGATAATLYSTLVTDTQGRTTFDGDYDLGRHLNVGRVTDFIAGNLGAFTVNQAGTVTASEGGTYSVGEDVYAGYVMATLDIGKLRVIPGVRVEATRTETQANKVSQTGSNVPVLTPLTGGTNYVNAFPSLNATFRVDELTNVRAAVTTALVRPQFRDMAPYVNIVAGQPTASIGNPNLKATTAIAYDAMIERYFRNVGFASIGVFYKDITNFIYPTSRARLASEDLGPDATLVTQPQNGPTAKLYGYEIAWQQNLTFLPGLLRGLGLNANYTYTKSESDIPSRPGVKIQIPGQTGNAANLGVFYDRGPVSFRVGGNYSGKFLSTINPNTPLGDTRTLARLQWDASGSVAITSKAKIFMEAINLTNTPLRATVGDRDNRGGGGDDPSFEFYKTWFMVGLKLER